MSGMYILRAPWGADPSVRPAPPNACPAPNERDSCCHALPGSRRHDRASVNSVFEFNCMQSIYHCISGVVIREPHSSSPLPFRAHPTYYTPQSFCWLSVSF